MAVNGMVNILPVIPIGARGFKCTLQAILLIYIATMKSARTNLNSRTELPSM